MLRQFLGMFLQLDEIFEWISAVQFASVDQTHEQVAHFGAVLGPIEQAVLSVQKAFLQSPLHDVRIQRRAGRSVGASVRLREGVDNARAAAQVLTEVLYRASVSPTDPIGLAAAVAAVAAVGLLAAYAPARRALRVNPMDALREE